MEHVRFSLVNVEKVVNPRIARRKEQRHSEVSNGLFVAMPVSNPRIKLPDTFTRSVPKGIDKKSVRRLILET
jgi:hypothetical protein